VKAPAGRLRGHTERAAGWTDADRRIIAAELEHVVTNIELAGFHCVWLAGDATADIAEADRITRDAGLGAGTREEEEPVLRRYLAEASAQFAQLGVHLPAVGFDVHNGSSARFGDQAEGVMGVNDGLPHL
jgi:hypothetical protein